jgi:catechol 2,3-dioxygenase-like lactoylglutathione lyase family enzyme
MLGDATVQPMLPVKDLKAAEKFYEEKLGLRRVGGAPDAAVVYQSGGSTLCVYRSEFAGTNKGTAALWEVDDVPATAAELKSQGVAFEHYDDLPGLTRKGDIHLADGLKVAWFKDPDGNILSIQNRPAKSGQS